MKDRFWPNELSSLAGTAVLAATIAVVDRPAVDAQTVTLPENPQANTLLIDNQQGRATVITTDDSLWRVTDQRNPSGDPKPPEEPKAAVPFAGDQKPDEKPNTEGHNEPTDVVSGGGSADQESTVVREYPQKNPDGSVVLVKEWTNGKFTTEVVELASAPPKIVKEVVRTYSEERPDGSVWLVVQYSDGSFGQDMIFGPTRQAQPPAQPSVSAPPPASTASSSGLVKSDEVCAAPYADRGPARKEFPPQSEGPGIYDSPPGVNPPLKIIYGKVAHIGRLENGQVGIVLDVERYGMINIEVITRQTADALAKQGKKIQPTTMYYRDATKGVGQPSERVPSPTLCQVEAILEPGDTLFLNVEVSWFDGSVFGFGKPTRAIFFYG